MFSCSNTRYATTFFPVLAVMAVFIAGVTLAQTASAGHDTRVSLLDYQQHALDVGGDNEDWQPAFQAALEVARDTGKPLHVPAGTYLIRQAINVVHAGKPGLFLNPQKIQIVGDGPNHSNIIQKVPTENAINWTGPTYKESTSGGAMRDISVSGGDVTLNIKWHNHFHMDNCYIASAQTYGVHAEGWSSRFANSTIRWCRQAGLYGRSHFNNIKIEGMYFSRNGRGIHLIGGNGVFISNSGLESNASAAIVIQHTSKPVITSCYFEGNGHDRGPDILDIGIGFPSTIHLDGVANSVVIENNIFRGGQGYNSASQVAIAGCEGARIRGNLFANSLVAVKLLAESQISQATVGPIKGLIVTGNTIETRDKVLALRGAPGTFLAESEPGLIERSLAHSSVFEEPLEITRKNTYEDE